MPRWRLTATAEYSYIDVIEAPTAADAAAALVARVRAGAITPVVGPGITVVDSRRLCDEDEQ